MRAYSIKYETKNEKAAGSIAILSLKIQLPHDIYTKRIAWH